MPEPPLRSLPILALILVAGACGDPDPDPRAGESTRSEARAADTAGRDGPAGQTRRPAEATGPERAQRPGTRTDTLYIEGMPEPMELRLFRAPSGFPLPFTAYVPTDLEPAVSDERSVHFTALFGGTRTEDAFVHLYVFPEGTDRQEAVAHAKGYKSGRGLPVGQGLEPIADDVTPPSLSWAIEDFRFRYQSGGAWFAGTLGVGVHDGRHYMLVRHRPAEFGDGFAPRADVILETWLWADGSELHATDREPPPIVEEATGR